jgi:hypothetical protein
MITGPQDEIIKSGNTYTELSWTLYAMFQKWSENNDCIVTTHRFQELSSFLL